VCHGPIWSGTACLLAGCLDFLGLGVGSAIGPRSCHVPHLEVVGH
jgi:hypothetical protein